MIFHIITRILSTVTSFDNFLYRCIRFNHVGNYSCHRFSLYEDVLYFLRPHRASVDIIASVRAISI